MTHANTNITTLSGSTEGLRQRNRALLLSVLRADGPANHADLTKRSGLATGTVSTITNELQADGVLQKTDLRTDGRGRPRTVWKLNPDAANIAFVRVTAERIQFTSLNYNGGTKDQILLDRTKPAAAELLKQLREGLERLVSRSNLSLESLDWVCITSRAPVSAGCTVLEWSPVIGHEHIDFGQIAPELENRISLTHEASTVASQTLMTSGDDRRQQAVLILGNSIGFGVAERHAMQVVQTFAPGLAHTNHLPLGPLCECGSVGCIESIAGFYGILRNAMHGPKDRVAARFIPLEQMERLAGQARNGNQQIIKAFRDAGEALGLGISRFFSFNQSMPLLVIGTGVTFYDLIEESFLSAINTSLQARLSGTSEISVRSDTDELVLLSGISVSLRQVDENLVSKRKLVKSDGSDQHINDEPKTA